MPTPPAAPARWPALLLLSAALGLQGCSALRPAPAGATHEDAATLAAQSGTAAVFDVRIDAPDAVREYLTRHLELLRFRHLPDLQPQELERLLGAAEAHVRDLLGTLGHFAPVITIALDEPETGADAALRQVRITVQPGPVTRVIAAQVQVDGDQAITAADEEARRQWARVQRNWPLEPGMPFTQQGWDGAKNAGLRQLQARRHPTARIADSRADIDADRHEARLAVTYDPGPAFRFGPLQLRGSQRYDPEGARRIARLPTGSVYDEAQMLDAQLRLASSGYYDAVFLTLDTEAADPQAAPVVAQVRESPLQKMVLGAGASTDSGPRLSLDHTHNRLPGIGWRALSKISLDRETQLLSSEWTALPDEQGWRWFTGAQRQRETTGDYDVGSSRLRAGRTQNSDHIDRTLFVQWDKARSEGADAPPSGAALSAHWSWTGRYFNSPIAPTRGQGLALELGLGTTLRPERDPFVRALARWQRFVPLDRVRADSGRSRSSRLALRAEVGAVLARDEARIPVTQLFVTGGDTTVRGYGYRSIGARTEAGRVTGGRYLAVGSVEWQRPIVWNGELTTLESTLFLDAGAVADRPADLDPRVGVGAGVRWRSPVGPLQADLAWGAQERRLRLHLRLGFSF
ncbi:MAG: autotransporter assembly complex protein TamA [Burkholderiaceae bacterium]